MSIPIVTETGRLPASTTSRSPAAVAAAPARPSRPNPSATGQEATPEPPTPPRFPWLSRLSQQLESAAKRKAAFPSTPILGDNVDRSV